MRYPSVRPHADPGPFPTSTGFLTGTQSDSVTDGQVDYKRTKDASSRCQMLNAAQILAPSAFHTKAIIHRLLRL